MRAWLADDMHRDTVLGVLWRDGGVTVRRAPATLGPVVATVWVAHFGSGLGPDPGSGPSSGAGGATGSGSTSGAGGAASSGAGGATGTGPRVVSGGSSQSGAGGETRAPGSAGAAGRIPGLRLAVTPSRARSGRRTRFRFVLSAAIAGGRRAIPWKLVFFARQRVLADGRGRASVVARPKRPGRYRAVAVVDGVRVTATVVVVAHR